MLIQQFLILCIFIIHLPATEQYPSGSCIFDPCQHGGICTPTGRRTYECKCTSDYYGKNCQISKEVDNPVNNCRTNICNTGRCISLKATYYCQCPDDRYGDHCEKRFNKRNVSDRQSFYYLFKRMNRDRNRHYDSDENDNGGRAYYDFKNGIYF